MKWPARLVHIEWRDSYSIGTTAWVNLKEMGSATSPDIIHTVGWVHAETQDWISIVPHISFDRAKPNKPRTISGHMSIPKCSIINVRELKLGDGCEF